MSKEQWQDQAYYAARKALRYNRKPFLAEKLLQDVVHYVGMPAEPRNWGNVIKRLADENLIEKSGIAPAKTSHYSAKWLWSRK